MRKFNIYHKNTKINKRPLNNDELEKLMKSKIITKKYDNGEIKQISLKDVKVIECIII